MTDGFQCLRYLLLSRQNQLCEITKLISRGSVQVLRRSQKVWVHSAALRNACDNAALRIERFINSKMPSSFIGIVGRHSSNCTRFAERLRRVTHGQSLNSALRGDKPVRQQTAHIFLFVVGVTRELSNVKRKSIMVHS